MFHAEEVIKGLNVIIHVLFCEVRMVWLKRKVLENFSSFGHKEASDFFNARLFLKELRIFQFSAMLGVVSHEIFSQVDAGVKALSDAGID